jgi:hypothetical protein
VNIYKKNGSINFKASISSWILSFHSSDHKVCYLLGYNAFSVVKVNTRYGGTSPPSSGWKNKPRNKPKLCLLSDSYKCLVWLNLQPWNWRLYVPPKCRLTFNWYTQRCSHKKEHFTGLLLESERNYGQQVESYLHIKSVYTRQVWQRQLIHLLDHIDFQILNYHLISQENSIVTCIPIAKQRLGEHVPAVNTPHQ